MNILAILGIFLSGAAVGVLFARHELAAVKARLAVAERLAAFADHTRVCINSWTLQCTCDYPKAAAAYEALNASGLDPVPIAERLEELERRASR